MSAQDPVNLLSLARTFTGPRTNVVVHQTNESCTRLAAFTGVYPWHCHPDSDEQFLVLEGELFIDLADGTTVALRPFDAFTVPAGMVHQTRSNVRTVASKVAVSGMMFRLVPAWKDPIVSTVGANVSIDRVIATCSTLTISHAAAKSPPSDRSWYARTRFCLPSS